jgi:3-isopropylmalate/(R)-2-methylmalate dehydratase small subunit
MKLKGYVFKCPDNIDTDVIIPAKYLNTSDPNFLAQHCLEPLVEQLNTQLTSDHIIVAGRNFGCGSSREHAPLSIKAKGIKCVVAESFARIFFRNAINIGLPLVELPDATKKFDFNDEIEIDFINGVVKNNSKFVEYKITPFPEFLQKIISFGGIIEFVQKNLV